MKANITVEKTRKISDIDKRLYGSFIEHLGRAVYEGIYEPTHPTADALGFRNDVKTIISTLEVPIIRYPGGNFVSGYHWEDGTGPKENRPRKMELAWNSIETNEVGIDEFQEWAKQVGSQVMMAVNLGTRGPQEARDLVEYCNLNTDTYYANMRKENGFSDPFSIKTWCLGNEMDGDWQICHLDASDYAKKACEAAKMMKMTDSTIELVACGSSSPAMATFGTWEETVLRQLYDHIDFLSLHSYYGNHSDNTLDYLASSHTMDCFIEEVIEICDKVKAEKNSNKNIMLSFDEWNVWFHSSDQDKQIPKWQVAPPLLEDIYNLEDALVVGCLINSLINHSDRIKIGCLAQLVNVIAPIMTVAGQEVWFQTIFYPYKNACLYGHGVALQVDLDCPTYLTSDNKVISYLDSSVVFNEDSNTLTFFLVNRHLEDSITMDLHLKDFGQAELISHEVLSHSDLKATNSSVQPLNVAPTVGSTEGFTGILPAHSYNMIRYQLL